MTAVFLDFATVGRDGLDATALWAAAPGLVLHDDTMPDEVAARIAGHEVVLLNKVRMTRALIEGAPALRVIGLTATGTNNIDLEAARGRGVAVRNIRDYCTPSVVQHVLGVLLYLTHRLPQYAREAVDGTWANSATFGLTHHPIRELRGRVLGIVGWGALGSAVARACESALGMQVIVADRPGGEPQPGRVPLDALLARADVVSLHCPLTPHTTGMIDARRLALMKPDAVLINTARGALIDPAALADALRAGRLGGAAIDVLPQEPPVDGSPLLDPTLPNLIVTPHMAWAARESRQRSLDELAANIADWRAGGDRGKVV
jgi:glycerate dehydrogenase